MHRSGKFFWIIAESTLKPKKELNAYGFLPIKGLWTP